MIKVRKNKCKINGNIEQLINEMVVLANNFKNNGIPQELIDYSVGLGFAEDMNKYNKENKHKYIIGMQKFFNNYLDLPDIIEELKIELESEE